MLSTLLERKQSNLSGTEWLSASILHDIRNPLGTVYAGAEMLMDLDPTSTQAKRLAANIYRAAGRMRDLLGDLARGTSPVETCCICDIVVAASHAASAAAEDRGVEILLDIPAGMEIRAMRTRLERVFINLINNSIEAMPRGGLIDIRAKRSGDCVLVTVEDTGPGLHPGISGRLFEPYATAGKDNGLGLGLALSRQTVLEHGGDMWSEPAEGARFIVRLPLRIC
jgi:signal transduction histidine kinase